LPIDPVGFVESCQLPKTAHRALKICLNINEDIALVNNSRP
jgi:hypothetical protein